MRLQVLHLPAPADEYPFVLVVDDVGPSPSHTEALAESADRIAAKVGARAVLFFSEPVEVL
jgi:hypothetical protein